MMNILFQFIKKYKWQIIIIVLFLSNLRYCIQKYHYQNAYYLINTKHQLYVDSIQKYYNKTIIEYNKRMNDTLLYKFLYYEQLLDKNKIKLDGVIVNNK